MIHDSKSCYNTPMLISPQKVLIKIEPNDLVLDIGGWAEVFNRANYVLDFQPFETRHKKTGKEYFSKKNWIIHDVNVIPWPFSNKQFDFVICSHVLEDIRDPIGVAREIQRVGKAGYIEVPSREYESTASVDPFPTGDKFTGLSHHRWLIEKTRNGLLFTFKRPYISTIKELQIQNPKIPIISFFWKNNFEVKENLLEWQEALDNLIHFKSQHDKIPYEKLKRYVNLKLNILKLKRKLMQVLKF